MLQLSETATALTASRFVTWLMLDGSHEKNGMAKRNPVLMDEAIEFYLSQLNKHSKQIIPFTFISLYSDEEPYSLQELIVFLTLRIEKVKQYREAHGVDFSNDKLTISSLEYRLKRLRYLQQKRAS